MGPCAGFGGEKAFPARLPRRHGRVWFAGFMPTFRSRLVARETLYGAWSVIPSALSVRLLAAAGLDYVVIDLQHGGATESDLSGMTSAIRLAGAAPVARVRHAHPADIGRALDLGCEGVIVPPCRLGCPGHQGGRGGPLPSRRIPLRGRRAGWRGAVLHRHG